jgi:hypothetical protein
MNAEKKTIFLIAALFMCMFCITQKWASLIGALFCFAIFALFVCIEALNKNVDIPKSIPESSEELKKIVAVHNEAILRIEDRIAASEIALGFRQNKKDE